MTRLALLLTLTATSTLGCGAAPIALPWQAPIPASLTVHLPASPASAFRLASLPGDTAAVKFRLTNAALLQAPLEVRLAFLPGASHTFEQLKPGEGYALHCQALSETDAVLAESRVVLQTDPDGRPLSDAHGRARTLETFSLSQGANALQAQLLVAPLPIRIALP